MRVERASRRLIGLCFVALALYVGVTAAARLWLRMVPERSVLGIVVTTLSVAVMPLLARKKREVAVALASGALRSDAKQTDLCAYLSAITLGGALLNAVLGWWWADAVAAFAMVPIIAQEGVSALRRS